MFIAMFFGGCKQNQFPNVNQKFERSYTPVTLFGDGIVYSELHKAIKEISNQLLLNINDPLRRNNKIAITSFVNLDNFKETSSFGRVIAETLIDDLHTKRFQVIDFRKLSAITVNSTGEFILTRDTAKMVDEIPFAYLLVGTYSIIDNNRIVINARILNNETMDVLSTAKVILHNYKTCKDFNLCDTEKEKKNNEKSSCCIDEKLSCEKECDDSKAIMPILQY